MEKRELEVAAADKRELEVAAADKRELEVEFLGSLEEVTFNGSFGSRTDPFLNSRTGC
jgi:hypothetical protein